MTANTSAKGSSVSIDNNGLARYKGFTLVETPAQYFDTGVVAIFSPDGIVIPFVGISTARAVETPQFDGVLLQAAAKVVLTCLMITRKQLSKSLVLWLRR